jgi:hypothetical protein
LPAGATVHPVFNQSCYVTIRKREPLSAIVFTGTGGVPNGLTYPTTIVKCMVLCFISFGFLLPLWWWLLGKKVPELTWSVDEYGVVSKTQNAIPKAQRTLRWIVLGVTVSWWMAVAISSTQSAHADGGDQARLYQPFSTAGGPFVGPNAYRS